MNRGRARLTEAGKKRAPSRSALRREREREHRYQTILQATERLFAVEGYHKASMEQIADASEVSVGTVYFYFKNKEDLLIRLLDEIGSQLRGLLGAEYKKADVSLEGFMGAGRVFFEEFCPRYPEKLAIFFRESVGQSELVEEHRKRIFEKLIADVKQALLRTASARKTSFRSKLSAEVMAASILGMFERLAYQYLIWHDRSDDLKTVGQDAMAFIGGGIQNLSR